MKNSIDKRESESGGRWGVIGRERKREREEAREEKEGGREDKSGEKRV